MELGYDDDVPTYEDIVVEFTENLRYGVFAMMNMSPLMNLDKQISDLNNFAKVAKSKENTVEVFMSEKMIERLKYSLVLFDQMGALDE